MWILGLFEVADWLLLLTTVICATHLYLTWSPLYWQRRGVSGPPHYPIIGSVSFLSAAEKAKCSVEDYGRKNYGKVFGYTMADAHFLVVFDKEMLRQILVKDFNNFSDPMMMSTVWEIVRILDQNIGNVCDNDEDIEVKRGNDRNMQRTTQYMQLVVEKNLRHEKNSGKSPRSFPDCVLIRLMSKVTWGSYLGVIINIKNQLDIRAPSYSNKGTLIHFKYISIPLMNSARNIGDCEQMYATIPNARIDSQEGKDLIRHAKKAFKVDIEDYKTPAFMIWFFVPWLMPFLSRFMNTKMTDQTSMRYFAKIVEEIYASRGEEDKGRKDLMQVMMNAHEEEIDVETVNQETKELGGQFDHAEIKVRKGLSKQEIVAQGCAMFAGGHDTLAGTLSFLAYNLACYPDCQERLHEELVDLFGEAGNPDYSSLNKSPYLNMCIEETLRLYPILIMIQRRCSGNTTVGGIRVEKGDIISIPVLSIHRDPKIYPDPEKFDPERFTEEAKAARSPFHYLPFGYGPRHCVGMRLALMVMKAAMINLLRKYRFITCEKTEIPIDLQPAVLLKAKNGIWLKTERRSQAGSC